MELFQVRVVPLEGGDGETYAQWHILAADLPHAHAIAATLAPGVCAEQAPSVEHCASGGRGTDCTLMFWSYPIASEDYPSGGVIMLTVEQSEWIAGPAIPPALERVVPGGWQLPFWIVELEFEGVGDTGYFDDDELDEDGNPYVAPERAGVRGPGHLHALVAAPDEATARAYAEQITPAILADGDVGYPWQTVPVLPVSALSVTRLPDLPRGGVIGAFADRQGMGYPGRPMSPEEAAAVTVEFEGGYDA
jgi:hypothetical protein